MQINKLHTVKEIQQIFKDAAPKFVCLKNAGNQFIFHYNSVRDAAADRFAEIVKYLNKNTCPPGIYYVCTRMSTMRTAEEISYPVTVGGATMQESGAVTVHQAPPVTQSVWTFHEALNIISEKQRLEIQLDFANERIKQLESQVQELQQELDDQDRQLSQPGDGSAAGGWLKDAKETFAPLLDIYFEQRDRQLSLEEKKAGIDRSRQLRKVVRSDGGLVPDDPGYQEYFERILKSGNENDLNHECDYLEANFPDFYQVVVKKYGITDQDDEPEIKAAQ